MVAVDALATALQEAADRGVAADYTHLLEVWREHRREHLARLDPAAGDPQLLPIARLEAALARTGAGGGEAEVLAGHLLRAAGVPAEALLHEQACRLATLPTGPADPSEVAGVAAHMRSLAAEVERIGSAGDIAVAHTRSALAAQVASAVAGPDDVAAAARWREAVADALDAFEEVPQAQMNGTRRGNLATVLRQVAQLQYGPEQVATLRRALGVLPPGVRLPERALVQFDLAFAISAFGDIVFGDPLRDAPTELSETDEAMSVIQLLSGAADDGAGGGDGAVTGRALMALGAVLHQHGQVEAAVESVSHAVIWFESEGDTRSADAARHDLRDMQS